MRVWTARPVPVVVAPIRLIVWRETRGLARQLMPEAGAVAV